MEPQLPQSTSEWWVGEIREGGMKQQNSVTQEKKTPLSLKTFPAKLTTVSRGATIAFYVNMHRLPRPHFTQRRRSPMHLHLGH